MTDHKHGVCPKCGGEMDDGRIPKGLNWLSGYKSNSQKHFSLELNFEKAKACLECGYVEMYLDPEKLKRKRAHQEQGENQ